MGKTVCAEGHPFYSVATFYTVREVIALARESGFYLDRATSCLAERPEPERITYRHPQERIVKNAGFVGLRFKIEGR